MSALFPKHVIARAGHFIQNCIQLKARKKEKHNTDMVRKILTELLIYLSPRKIQ